NRPTTGIAARCANAANGQAAALPISALKSRRRTHPLQGPRRYVVIVIWFALNRKRAESALGQSLRTWAVSAMSGLPLLATRQWTSLEVRFVPRPDMVSYSITSSARANKDAGNVRPSAFAVLWLITS